MKLENQIKELRQAKKYILKEGCGICAALYHLEKDDLFLLRRKCRKYAVNVVPTVYPHWWPLNKYYLKYRIATIDATIESINKQIKRRNKVKHQKKT